MPTGIYTRTPEQTALMVARLSVARNKWIETSTKEDRRKQTKNAVEAARLLPRKIPDRVGKIFGKWTVISFQGMKNQASHWLIRCECGNERTESARSMGRSESCGCSNVVDPRTTRNLVLCDYRGRARERDLDWSLTDEQFEIRISENCFYCGLEPSNRKRNPHGGPVLLYSGIDRKNNELGYTFENTVSCCSVCNHAKHILSAEQFTAWIKRAYEHSFGSV